MKKPNIRKLKETDRLSNVVYKGRYFFDDKDFTNKLFEKNYSKHSFLSTSCLTSLRACLSTSRL